MLSILFPILIACSERPPSEKPQQNPSQDIPETGECEEIERLTIEDQNILDVVESNHEFAFNIYEELRVDLDNVFLSPISISTALGMLHLGAEGNTESEMSDMLGVFQDDANDWHSGQGALVQEFDLGHNCDYKLSVANKAFFQVGYEYNPNFIDDLSLYYDSELSELNFSADPEAARQEINGWVSDKTNERIPELFSEGQIMSSTKLVLTNAIYMDAPWKDSFDPNNTYTTQFNKADGSTSDVEMMSGFEMSYRVGIHEDFQIVEIPYQGDDLAFTAIVPNAVDGLEEIEENLSVDSLAEWKSTMYATEGGLEMPKFEMRSKEILNDTLQKLGMVDAFGGSADFSGISEESQPRVNIVIHEAWLQISEEGTEAAAATGVGTFDTSAPESVILNRPFLFMIEDKRSGSILFIGKISDPSSL
jgi:serpin B